MDTQLLAQHAQAYLDATNDLRRRRAAWAPKSALARAAAEAARAERELVDRLDRPHDYPARPLVEAARGYIEAERRYEQAVATGDPSDAQTQEMNDARAALEARLDRQVYELRDPTGGSDSPARRTIVIAVDDGDPARWAVQVGGRLARDTGASVVLVHVLVPVPLVAGEFGIVGEELRADDEDMAKQLLEAASRLIPPGVPCERAVRVGAVADELVVAARLWRAELLVIGTRSRGRLTQFLLGSVADSVVRHAPCPVLTVGHPPVAAAAADLALESAREPEVSVER